ARELDPRPHRMDTMNGFVPFVLFFQLSFGGAPSQSATPDRWFGEDKFRHFFMSVAVTNLSFAAARTVGVPGTPALIAAGAVSVAAGIGKEFHDLNNGRPFSRRDLVWDGLGTGVGLILAAQTY